MLYPLTRHARTRSQQRAIPESVLDLVIAFGRSTRSGDADSYWLDESGRNELRELLGPRAFKKLERRLGCYVVVSDDGRIVTVAHCWRRQRD